MQTIMREMLMQIVYLEFDYNSSFSSIFISLFSFSFFFLYSLSTYLSANAH